jgi:hypothetical protein
MGGHEAPRRLGVNRGQVATENPSTSGSCWHRRHCSLQLVCHAQFVEPKEKGKAWGAKLRARCQHSDWGFKYEETTLEQFLLNFEKAKAKINECLVPLPAALSAFTSRSKQRFHA